MEEIIGEKYHVRYDESANRVICQGIMDMRGKEEYKPVSDLFEAVVNKEPDVITLDLRELEFLNSSGITAMGGFIIKVRNKGKSQFVIHCSRAYAWQERSVKGLKKLMPGLELRFD